MSVQQIVFRKKTEPGLGVKISPNQKGTVVHLIEVQVSLKILLFSVINLRKMQLTQNLAWASDYILNLLLGATEVKK